MTALKGECNMLYAVRKRRGHWTVCADDNVVLQFETYDEAVSTAQQEEPPQASDEDWCALSVRQLADRAE